MDESHMKAPKDDMAEDHLTALVVQEARENFPEYFARATDQEIINEIAEAVKKYGQG